MRAIACGAVMALVFTSACVLRAQELPSIPLSGAPESPVPPGAAAPDATVPAQPNVPTSPAGIQPGPPVPSPHGLAPSPVAPSLPPSGYVPEAEPPPPELPGDFVQLSGDQVRTVFEDREPVSSIAEGNVTVRFRDIVGTASRSTIDYRTQIATFEGNVVLRLGPQEARGEQVTLNLRTREWTGLDASTTVLPEFARGWLRAPLFADADRLHGQGRRQIDAYDSESTTCNLDHPHYEFRSKSVSVYPNNKIVLRKVSMYVLGRRLFTVPRFVVPLRQIQRNPNIIPRFGQSEEEGYFLKTAYSYMGTRTMAGFLLLDLMSRKGIGKGFRHSWQYPTFSGDAQLYHIYDRNIDQDTLTGRLTHNHLLGTIRANVSTDFRSNSYLYAPESKTLGTRLTLTRDRAGANSSLAVTQSINSSFARTSSTSAYFSHRQQFGDRTSLDTNFDYAGYRSTATQARLTSQVVFSKKEDKFDWSLSAQKLTDLSDEAFAGQGVFAGIERLPEIGILTDTTRLGKTLPFGIPARLKVTNGHYVELPATTSLNRTYVELNTPVQRYTLSDTWSFGAGAGFRQYIYSDSTAQYSVDTSAQLVKRFGPASSFDLSYRYQRPRGFTPFRFDYVGRYNIATASLNLQDSEKFKLSVFSGYNFEQQDFPWQDITIRFSFQPTSSFLFYTATGYDVNRSQWRTLINQIRVRARDRFRMDIGTRYDTIREQLAQARVVLDSALGPKMRLQAVSDYNGFTKQFDYSSVMLTRDLHCWEASLVYTRQTGFFESQGVTFNLRIKAFPFFREFGAGQFGQALDPSVGQVY
jgi:hypothetical protein